MIFADILKRIMRRAELNVAVAGAMVGSVAAMSKLYPVMERYRKLKVTFYGGHWLSWDSWRDDGADPADAFRDFIRWYHGRPQSECYVMRFNGGEEMFRRCDIRGYGITSGLRERDAAGETPKP